ncbi:tautomerase family protein [Desulfocicer niacini]
MNSQKEFNTPFVNVKILKNQFDEPKKKKLISDLTNLIVNVICQAERAAELIPTCL